MSAVEVKVPDIGDFKDVPVIEVLVKPGDTVEAEDSLVTLESDKATMDVPSPAAGTVKEVKVKLGDKVSEGTLIVVLDAAAAARSEAAPAGAAAPAPRHRPPRLAALLPQPGARTAARRPRRPSRAPRPTPARPTSNARCWCWARDPAATAPRSAPPISA